MYLRHNRFSPSKSRPNLTSFAEVSRMWKNPLYSIARMVDYPSVASGDRQKKSRRRRSRSIAAIDSRKFASIRWLLCACEELSWKSVVSRYYHEETQHRSAIGFTVRRVVGVGGTGCCTERVRKYVLRYHRCLYVRGYEQTRTAVYIPDCHLWN